MKSTTLMVNSILLLVAFLWGVGFAPQRLGMETLEPIAFNAWRFAFGALTLLPVLYFSNVSLAKLLHPPAIFAGLFLGVFLCAAAGLQQVSLGLTKVANVAFITGFYVILVPIMGLFMAHRYSLITWFGGLLALVGLALLSGFDGQISFNSEMFKGDLYALLGACFWAFHLLSITYFVVRYNQLTLAFYQFVFCAILSAIASMVFETQLLPTGNMGYVWAVVNGVIVVGVAYTLQVIVLSKADPFVAAIIFSLEAVFGALVGYLVFNELMGFYALIGAALMLLGFVLAQVHEKKTPP